ncbi:pimeloyl-ACP methyl ester carboxylesterase [Geodermatophilus tzadiensis]|uniref:Pimeloyl-ACP methyl ester carboxylesterase n=1 Tax=Geodermatophilus tzadiensis TaxID=1137988 RepID=A0A2T0TSR0_9ACTN|nr:alpha/beta hydrolase [Geodermatophilus tzadiensis]PRY48742.1 pimeloyl-ACP methyl ester carboxylesterase [Geodermatophilus tzadiensis]
MDVSGPRAIRPVDLSAWSPPLPEAPGFEHHVVGTPGLRTHLAAIGEGDPVVLLHGFPQHWWQWRAVAPAIAARGHRVLCPDLRGAGWTVADDPRVGRETRLGDLLALLDVLQVERVHLVSHDLGAITAMQLSYDHPERVRTAVQLSVPPGFMTMNPRVAPGFRHLPSFIWHRPGASLAGIFSTRYVAQPMAATTVEAHLAPMRRPDVDAAVRTLTRGIAVPEGMRMARGVYRRRRLTVPTLFVFGRRDRYWNEAIIGRVCRHPERYADRAEFAYVEDAAHFVTDDAPAAVADLALDWFRRAAGAGASPTPAP